MAEFLVVPTPVVGVLLLVGAGAELVAPFQAVVPSGHGGGWPDSLQSPKRGALDDCSLAGAMSV